MNIKTNIKKKTVILSNLKIWKTTKYLSKTTDFNKNSATYEKNIILPHHQNSEEGSGNIDLDRGDIDFSLSDGNGLQIDIEFFFTDKIETHSAK